MAIASPRRFFRIFMSALLPVVFLAGVFFSANAQSQLPDLVLEEVSLAGTGAAVVYRNDGVAVNGRAYTVSFQWVDASGAALSPKQTLARNAMAARGRDILTWNSTTVQGTVMATEQRCYSTGSWFRRSTRCDSVQVPRTVTQSLAAYRAARPRTDAFLSVILDDGNQIAESNEGNNTARVGDTPFRAAPPSPPSELAITRATFDGKDLFAVFQNQSSVAIANQPFEVGVQWLDQNGVVTGEKRFIRFKNLASAAVAIIDSKTGITASFQTGPGADDLSAETLSAYLSRRPADAVKIKITLDERGQISEINETNNTALINLPNPDFMMMTPIFTTQVLSFRYVNAGSPLSAQANPVSFWFEWVDAKGVRIGNHLYWHDRPAGAFPPNLPLTFASNGIRVSSSGGELLLDQVLQNAPVEAVALKITLDGPNVFRENNEENNSVVLPKPFRPLPDLVFGNVEVKNGALRIEVRNDGVIPSAPADLLVQWFNADSSPNISSLISAATGTTPIYPRTSRIITLSLSGQTPSERLVANPPKNATRLQLLVDPIKRIAEINEDNNMTAIDRSKLAPPLPDLAITKDLQTLNGQQLMFSYANLNAGAPLTQFPMLSFWFEWVDADLARIGDHLYWHDRSAASIPPTPAPSIFTSRGVYVVFAKAFAPLDSVLQKPPEGAAFLRVTIDGPNKFNETDESNNTALFPVIAAPKPDFSLQDGERTPQVIKMKLVNAGAATAPRSPLWEFRWIGSDGKQLGTSARADYSIQWPKSGASAPFEIPYAQGREDAVNRLLKNPPAGASALEISLDPENQIEETDEKNNRLVIQLAQQPDFVFGAAAVRDGALHATVRNIGAGDAPAADIWLMWMSAQGGLPSSASVDLPALKSGASAEVIVPIGGTTEASRILKDPPKDAVRLRLFLDGSRRVEEANEQNNDTLLDRSVFAVKEAVPLSDLAFTLVHVPPGGDFLVIGFQNAGKAEAGGWQWQIKWLDAGGRIVGDTYRNTHPGLKPSWRYGATSDMQDKIGTPVPLGEFLKRPPAGAVDIEITIDPENKVEESNETNNVQRFEVATFPPSLRLSPEGLPPELTLTLATEIISHAQAAASSSATAGFALALLALASGGFLIYEHHGSEGGIRRFAGVFPLLFVPSSASYMRLRGCGSEGCAGQHFARHKGLKRMARTSLGVALAAGFVKLGFVWALLAFPVEPVFAGQAASRGDDVMVTLTTKNTGKGAVTGVTLRLACPFGTAWQSTRIGDRAENRDPAQGIEMERLASGASHRLSAVCRVKDDILKSLRFIGEAKFKTVSWVSNIVEVTIQPRTVTDVPKPGELPDLSIDGIGFLPLISVVEAQSAPLPSIFSAYVSNLGTKAAGASKARVRLDFGANGGWDVTSRLEATESLAPGAQVLIKIPFTWNAPLGTTVFEICADAGKEVEEADESNNCEKDRLMIQIGEEPAQEESGVEE